MRPVCSSRTSAGSSTSAPRAVLMNVDPSGSAAELGRADHPLGARQPWRVQRDDPARAHQLVEAHQGRAERRRLVGAQRRVVQRDGQVERGEQLDHPAPDRRRTDDADLGLVRPVTRQQLVHVDSPRTAQYRSRARGTPLAANRIIASVYSATGSALAHACDETATPRAYTSRVTTGRTEPAGVDDGSQPRRGREDLRVDEVRAPAGHQHLSLGQQGAGVTRQQVVGCRRDGDRRQSPAARRSATTGGCGTAGAREWRRGSWRCQDALCLTPWS